ncbi:DNA translocase FtsK, partial [Aphanothece microscopica]|uniref:DNA translocase FtsK n=1 Tax=Aphanothece microscopica TaxID=1049561 RepID=UPI0039852C82
QNNARILQEKLETFRIRIENLTVHPGPVVTQYEFVPAAGIKVSQIESLGDDIALALKAPGVRIIAPIPGRGTVGIEIPNHNPALVRFSSIIRSPKYHNPDIKLPIAMGKTVVGEVLCADLAKMPHLLIAGATGKGKSVGIN